MSSNERQTRHTCSTWGYGGPIGTCQYCGAKFDNSSNSPTKRPELFGMAIEDTP